MLDCAFAISDIKKPPDTYQIDLTMKERRGFGLLGVKRVCKSEILITRAFDLNFPFIDMLIVNVVCNFLCDSYFYTR